MNTERDYLAKHIATALDEAFHIRADGPAAQDYILADALMSKGYGLTNEAEADALEEAARHREQRGETFLNTMQGMAGNPGYTAEDVLRYGAYSVEASTTAYWLRNRAKQVRGK